MPTRCGLRHRTNQKPIIPSTTNASGGSNRGDRLLTERAVPPGGPPVVLGDLILPSSAVMSAVEIRTWMPG